METLVVTMVDTFLQKLLDPKPSEEKKIPVRQPSGRIIKPWPKTKEDMLTAWAESESITAFLTDEELAEVEAPVAHKESILIQHQEKVKKYGVPPEVVDSIIFKLGEMFQFFGDHNKKTIPTQPLSPSFRILWTPNIQESQVVAWQRQEMQQFFTSVTDTCWTHLKACVEDLTPCTTFADLQETAKRVFKTLTLPTILAKYPPDQEWCQQLAHLQQVLWRLFPEEDFLNDRTILKGTFDETCKMFDVKDLTFPMVEAHEDTFVKIQSGLIMSDKHLDLGFIAKHPRAHLSSFNLHFAPKWIVLPDGRTYVRTSHKQHPEKRLWLFDPRFERIALHLSFLVPSKQRCEWARELHACAVPWRRWSENDWADE